MQYSENDFKEFIKTYLKQYNAIKGKIYRFNLMDIKPQNIKKSEYGKFLSEFHEWNKTSNTKNYYFFEHGSQANTERFGVKIFNGNNTMMYCFMNHMIR